MSLLLQLHLVMMSKYSKLGADIFNNSFYWATLKFLHNKSNDLAIIIVQLFPQNSRANKKLTTYLEYKEI